MRVIADHFRTLACAIADGALPGNEGRGYVLRRILRRAARYGRKLGFTQPFLCEMTTVITQTLGSVFPELKDRRDLIFRVLKAEEESFNATLDRGLALFDEIVREAGQSESPYIAGKDAFKLYDTFGFPIDLTQVLAHEAGLTVDMEHFTVLLAEQKDRSRKVHASKKQIVKATTESLDIKSEFLGYDSLDSTGKVAYVENNVVVLDKTPFYAESGGQVSDTGILEIGGNPYRVTDVRKLAGGTAIGHVLEAEELDLTEGMDAGAEVDRIRRYDIQRNHTATHLVHSALRQILGEHVHQAGSLVNEKQLRFDFAHFQKVSDDELRAIEELVNEKVREAIQLMHHRNIPFDEAKKMGALMFFGEKYGERVNVVDFGPFSREFCGGTHVKNSSEIGLFKFISEASIASGTRRIEAVTGRGVEKYINAQIENFDELSREREKLEDEKRKLEKEIAKLKMASRKTEADDLVKSATNLNGSQIAVVSREVAASDAEEFKSFAEMVQAGMGNGKVALLGAKLGDDKVSLVAIVSDDLVKEKKLSAGKIVGKVAELVGGKGGGRPNFAQAGGKHPERLSEALEALPGVIREMV